MLLRSFGSENTSHTVNKGDNMADRVNYRILEIDFTTDNSDNDIADVDGVTYYRSGQSRTAGNGFSVTGFELSRSESVV